MPGKVENGPEAGRSAMATRHANASMAAPGGPVATSAVTPAPLRQGIVR